jgi:hypothetical protein
MKDWKMYSEVKNACILVMVVSIGVLIGINLPDNKPTKNYPIEVRCHWETSQSSYYPTMEADSVKGDTIWKDGNRIVNKNIRNVEFK